ncbi:MAG: LysR family transcriptional regulator [Thermomicrobiales bacterium]
MKERPTLHALAVYLAVMEHGTMHAAAEHESISQPAISAHVKSLERFFHAPLLERTGRRVRPTAAGDLVATYSRRMLALLDELEQGLADLAGLHIGRLVVGASSSFGEAILPGILGRFHRMYPGIELAARIGNTEEIVQGVLDRTVGFGIIGADRPDATLESWPIFDDTLDLFVAPTHPLLARTMPITHDLSRETFVLREPGSATRDLALRTLATYDIVPMRLIEFEGNEAVRRAVAAGMGVGILSEHTLAVDYRAGEVVRLKCADWECRRQFRVLHRYDRVLSRAEHAFLELLGRVPPMAMS